MILEVSEIQNRPFFFIISVSLCGVFIISVLTCVEQCAPLQRLSERMSIHAAARANSQPPPSFLNQSTTLQTHSHFSSHLFIQAVACCFTGTSPCFVLFSPLFVFNCYRGGQLISLPPLSICSPHSCGAVCLLAHLLPSPNATSLQMD